MGAGEQMNRLIHIGFGNIVNTDKIIAIVSPEAAPIKRLVQKAKETGQAIDATQGRKTKSVLVMENSQVVLSALLPETIAGRAQALWPEEEKEDREDADYGNIDGDLRILRSRQRNTGEKAVIGI